MRRDGLFLPRSSDIADERGAYLRFSSRRPSAWRWGRCSGFLFPQRRPGLAHDGVLGHFVANLLYVWRRARVKFQQAFVGGSRGWRSSPPCSPSPGRFRPEAGLGDYRTWDARLTSTFVLWLLYIVFAADADRAGLAGLSTDAWPDFRFLMCRWCLARSALVAHASGAGDRWAMLNAGLRRLRGRRFLQRTGDAHADGVSDRRAKTGWRNCGSRSTTDSTNWKSREEPRERFRGIPHRLGCFSYFI